MEAALGEIGKRVEAVDSTSAGFSSQFVPIAVPIPWFKHLLPEVAQVLPGNWVECNGQTIDDEASPLYGKVIPDLNGQGYFIRGSATAGTVQAAQNAAHVHEMGHNHTQDAHNHTQDAHTHTGNSSGSAGSSYPALRDSAAIDLSTHHSYIDAATATNQAATATNQAFVGNTASTGDSEARPINISAIYIMKIRE